MVISEGVRIWVIQPLATLCVIGFGYSIRMMQEALRRKEK